MTAPAGGTGKVFVITGANAGLGFETARNLAASSPDHTVILGCRDPQRGAEARRAITAATGSTRVRELRIDVSSMSSVREFVAACESEVERPIDALICNAGVSRARVPTVDGIETVFATNHLGHFLLTVSLLPKMSPDARVIAVSSDMHAPPGPALRWPGADAVAHGSGRAASPILRYPYSKLCNLYFVHELARRLRAAGSAVTAAAFNPGLMTETSFATTSRPVAAVMRRMFATRLGALAPSAAALTTLAATADPAVLDGHYFDRTASTWARSSALSYDERNARDLWEVSARLTGADL